MYKNDVDDDEQKGVYKGRVTPLYESTNMIADQSSGPNVYKSYSSVWKYKNDADPGPKQHVYKGRVTPLYIAVRRKEEMYKMMPIHPVNEQAL